MPHAHVVLEGESRFLVALRLGWWRRQSYKLFLQTLHRRLVCLVRGHQLGEPYPVLTSGPIHLSPGDRDYHLLGANQQCARCYVVHDAVVDISTEALWLQEAQMEDEDEWADPQTRQVLESLT